MTIHNVLVTEMVCPRCETLGSFEVETFFGFGNLDTYRVGDRVKWIDNAAVVSGGRPRNGNLDGEGYAVCPHCNRDFFVVVAVRDDLIASVAPDPTKPPHIPDP